MAIGTITAITAIVGLVIAGAGVAIDAAETDDAQTAEKEKFEKEFGLRQSNQETQNFLSNRQLKLNERELNFQKDEAQKTWKWKEEEADYKKALDFSNRMSDLLYSSQGFKQNLVNNLREREATNINKQSKLPILGI